MFAEKCGFLHFIFNTFIAYWGKSVGGGGGALSIFGQFWPITLSTP